MHISPLLLSIVLAGSLVMPSCSSEPTDRRELPPPPGSIPARPAANVAPAATIENTAPTAADGVQLNPPHGEPGHRCEIPVGAPLDGSTGVSAATQQTMTTGGDASPETFGKVASPPTNASGARLNPPHGEPGHICEIPVGEPLP